MSQDKPKKTQKQMKKKKNNNYTINSLQISNLMTFNVLNPHRNEI